MPAPATLPESSAQVDPLPIVPHNMVSGEHNTHLVARCSKLASSEFTHRSGIFANDNQRVYVCIDGLVHVYSVATGEQIDVLPSFDNTAGNSSITCAKLSPLEPNHLATGSADGTVTLWQCKEKCNLNEWQLDAPVVDVAFSAKQPEMLLSLTYDAQQDVSVLHRLHLNQECASTQLAQLQGRAEPTWSPDGTMVALVLDRELFIARIPTDANQQLHFESFKLDMRATCLAFHPCEASIAVGDAKGRITLWYYERRSADGRPTRSFMHWHAFRVHALAFTPDGVHLLSGGTEGTLVIWHLRSNKKLFLPRLGAEILAISTSADQAYYALTCKDNAVRILNAVDLSLVQSLQGLKRICNSGKRPDGLAGLVVEPRTGQIALNGATGSVQFFSTSSRRSVKDIQIAPIGPLTQHRRSDPVVNHIAFTSDGTWMITADVRSHLRYTTNQYIRFWRFEQGTQTYTMVTRADSPHRGKITSLAATVRNGVPMVVSTGEDRCWKAWGVSGDAPDVAWQCLFSCDFRNMRASDAAFSADGSILAVAFDDTVTLWDPWRVALTCTLPAPFPKNMIRHLRFVADSQYLVVSCASHFYIWDLLTCSVCWSYRFVVQHLAVDPSSLRFAVTGHPFDRMNDSLILEFNALDAAPSMTYAMSANAVTYVPQPHGRASLLAVLDDGGKLHALAAAADHEAPHSTNPAGQPTEPATLSAEGNGVFSQIFGKNAIVSKQAVNASSAVGQVTEAHAQRTDLWTMPAHMMPSVDSTYTHFMSGLIASRTKHHEPAVGAVFTAVAATDTTADSSVLATSFLSNDKQNASSVSEDRHDFTILSSIFKRQHCGI